MAHQLSYPDYLDRITAGWIGKSIGGAIGAPLENHKAYHGIGLDELWPDKVAANDDLDIQVVWLEALQERGLYLDSSDLAEFWADRCWYNFCEYGFFLHNHQRGIAAPLSGSFDNDFFAESEGCPIRSEIWGFVCPGNPRLAADFASLDGQLDHAGTAVEIERFLAACAAQAVLGSDLDAVLQAGLSVIPAGCAAARVVPAVRAICAACPDPAVAWRRVIRAYGDRDASKAITNHALVLMALFLGRLDFRQTMLLAARSGWDTDCTAATAGALLGAMLGTRALPQDWVSRLGPDLVCGIKVRHNGRPLTEFARETALLGVEMAQARNPLIRFDDAPVVAVRPPPPPAPRIGVHYPGEPVLRADAPGEVRVVIEHAGGPGRLEITAPPHLHATVHAPVIIIAGDQARADVSLELASGGTWLPDRNVVEAIWHPQDGPAVRRRFGLAGARQWQVYGPYWDMWDIDRFPACPFHNRTRKCHPGEVGLCGDSFNNHVGLDRRYLDEQRLLREDLPQEDPLRLQHGRELITGQDLGGFTGQACYYLVRTFRWNGPPRDSELAIGRIGPYRIWLDGALLGEGRGVQGWTPFATEAHRIRLSGARQRLVVKAVRCTDQFAFSAIFLGGGDPERRRGVSFVLDGIEDAVGP